MKAVDLIDNLVPISVFNHGGASKAFAKVGNDKPVVVLKNNQPAAVIISMDDYKRFTEAEEDFALYLEAMEREKHDDGTRLSREDVFGKNYQPIDDGYEVEFE
ncbi:type II toxin-antitoxin system Phd/YefM family antitoxin [Bifidobacterium sp. SO1]|nr:type II toxin-antitoxin system Phd/YefM family antitoxin [Bifidobacterium sp. SO1]